MHVDVWLLQQKCNFAAYRKQKKEQINVHQANFHQILMPYRKQEKEQIKWMHEKIVLHCNLLLFHVFSTLILNLLEYE